VLTVLGALRRVALRARQGDAQAAGGSRRQRDRAHDAVDVPEPPARCDGDCARRRLRTAAAAHLRSQMAWVRPLSL